MTFEKLKVRTRKELADMAKRHRVEGWHGMKKDELIEALLSMYQDRQKAQSRKNGSANGNHPESRPRRPGSNGSEIATLRNGNHKKPAMSGPARRLVNGTRHATKDQLVARACNSWWIHVQWELSPQIIARAEAALGTEWHQAVPIIRLYDVTKSDLSTTAKSFLKDIPIHGEVDHWYIPVDKPSQQLRLQIGYRAPSGKFFAMARSNTVSTPKPGTRGVVRQNGNGKGRNGESEEFLIREIHETQAASLSFLAERTVTSRAVDESADFTFSLEAELIVFGTTDPRHEFTLMGEAVPVAEDGSFSVRFSLPNGRQVIPAVAVTPDGAETRTIVMAIERNTKELEPQLLEEMSP